MIFGKYLLNGYLRDEADGNAGGGGDNKNADQPLTLQALSALLAENNAKLQADWKKQLEDTDKARKAEEQRKAAEAADAARKAEEERKRKEEEDRANASGGDQKTQYEINKLKERLEEERKKREASEAQTAAREAELKERERVSEIKSALSGYQFAKASNLEVAFKTVKDDIKRDDDGRLLGPGSAPLQDYLNDLFRPGGDLEGLLAPKGSGGSGATGGNAAGGHGAVDIDTIKPGANNEAARIAISRLARELMGSKR